MAASGTPPSLAGEEVAWEYGTQRQIAMVQATRVDLRVAIDDRGRLTAAQFPTELPFVPLRLFAVTGGSAGTVRGGHAHHSCHQFLIAATGSVRVEVDDDGGTREVTLADSNWGLHIPPLVWARQHYVDSQAILIVLASHQYDVNDYIDDRIEAAQLRVDQ